MKSAAAILAVAALLSGLSAQEDSTFQDSGTFTTNFGVPVSNGDANESLTISPRGESSLLLMLMPGMYPRETELRNDPAASASTALQMRWFKL